MLLEFRKTGGMDAAQLSRTSPGMDKQSPHLLLRVPTPDRQGLSLCDANPREMKRWLAALPKANIGETARQLYQCLTELNQLITPCDNRLQLLELLRPEVHFVCSHLARHFLNQSIVLDERPRKVANLCQALQNHLAMGYKLIVTEELPRFAKERAQLLAVALQRASHCLYGPLVRATQLYCPVPEGLWLELHQLHRIARQHGLQRAQVRDSLAHNGTSQSIEQIYLAALLLGCARCNQMRQSGIARLAEALESWSQLASLQRADAPTSLFAIASHLDGPPRYKSLFGATELSHLLGLDPHALVDAIKEHLLLPPDSAEASRLSVPEGMPGELLFQTLAGHCVAEEQIDRVFIVDKMATRVGLSLLATLGHGHAVITFVFDHRHAMGAQFVFLPLPGIGRHMHGHLKAQRSTHDADRHAEIAGGADGDFVLAKKGPGLVAVQQRVVVVELNQATGQGQVFGMLEHFIDPAAGLDRAGDGQMAVALEPQRAIEALPVTLAEQRLQMRQGQDVRLDNASTALCLREGNPQVGSKPPKACAGIGHVGTGQACIAKRLRHRCHPGVEPGGFLQRDQFADQREAGAPVFKCSAQNHGGVL